MSKDMRFHIWCETCGFRAEARRQVDADKKQFTHCSDSGHPYVITYEFFTSETLKRRRARLRAYV